MKKFRTWYDTRIEEVEVIRETAKFVMLSDLQRWAKRTEDSWNYFDTWEDARAFLIAREKSAMSDLKKQIETHEVLLQKIEAMEA